MNKLAIGLAVLAALLAAGAVGLSLSAAARLSQAAPPPAPSQRWQVVQTYYGDKRFPVLVDAETGDTWQLLADDPDPAKHWSKIPRP